ncbi:MAG: hypothetical protein ACI8SE_002105, partial [Bacteroidia bacterium]
MKQLKWIAFGLALMLTSVSGQCQIKDSSKVNQWRICALGGLPRIAGFQGEYILPFAENRYGIKADVSILPNIFPDSKTNTTYTGVGVNRYFNKKASGPYVGLSFGSLFITAEEIDYDPVDIDVRFNWLGGQLGIKTGNTFFFRFELGYSVIFYDVDKANEF